MKKITPWLAACLIGVSANTVAQTQKYDPEAMAWLCAPCHGTNGREFYESMPALAGLNPDYFIRTMIEFREGQRATVIMDRVARGFTDAEIEAMATWFAKQPAEQWTPEITHD